MFLCSSFTQHCLALQYSSATCQVMLGSQGEQAHYVDNYLLHYVKVEEADLLDGVDGNLFILSVVPPLLDKVTKDLSSKDEQLCEDIVIVTVTGDHQIMTFTRGCPSLENEEIVCGWSSFPQSCRC